MKPLPQGNYAMAIAHPGHELRLHGFLEQAKPFVFILTDNSEEKGEDQLWDSIKTIDRATKQGMNISPAQIKDPFMRKTFKYTLQQGEEQISLKDSMIQYEASNLHTDFFKDYIDWMVQKLIEYKINYLVCDATEEYHFTHEIMRMLCDLAIMKVKQRTGDVIELFDFALSKPYNDVMHEHVIQIELNEEAVERKLHAICIYPLAIADLKPNIHMEKDEIDYLRKKQIITFGQRIKNVIDWLLIIFHLKERKGIPNKEQFVFLKQALKEQNQYFFQHEYLRPAKMFKQTMSYQQFIQPIYGKLLKELTA